MHSETMQKIAFLFALLFALQASADDASRCGTDAFGNTICIGKYGGLTTAPMKSAADGAGDAAKGKSAPGGSSGESGVKSGREDQSGRMRCGINPFGNKVCR